MITNATAKSGPYTGNGSTTVFPYTFRIQAKSELTVLSISAGNVETTGTVDVDYTVTGVGSTSGGNVTFSVAPASGVQVFILLNPAKTQEANLLGKSSWQASAETVETGIDKLTSAVKQLNYEMTRTIRVPYSDSADAVTTTLGPAAAYDLVRVNAAATAYELATPNDVLGSLSAIGGSGTVNYVPVFTDTSTLGNSLMTEIGGTTMALGATALPAFINSATQLYVTGAGSPFARVMLQATSDDSLNSYIGFVKTRGVAGAETIVHDGDTVGALAFLVQTAAFSGTGNSSIASFGALVDGTPGVSGTPGAFWFNLVTDDGVHHRRIDLRPLGAYFNKDLEDWDFSVGTDSTANAIFVDGGANTFTVNVPMGVTGGLIVGGAASVGAGLTVTGGITATTTIAATGAVTGSNLSGTNTGNVTLAGETYITISGQVITAAAVNLSGSQATGTLAAARMPALTGDVTTSAGAVATTITANAVTLAMMAQVATARFLGRTTAGTGNVESLTVSQAQTLLGVSGTNTGDQTITLTGNVTGSGTGSFATTIAAGVVTNAMLAGSIDLSKLAQNSAAAGDVVAWSGSAWAPSTIVASRWQNGSAGSGAYSFANDTTTNIYLDSAGVLGIATAGVNRVLISSTGLTLTGALIVSGALTFSAPLDVSGANVTGVLAAARFPALTGDVTTVAGALATTIANNAVTLAKMDTMATASILGRNTAGAGNVEVLSATTTKTLLSLNLVENTALSTWAGSSSLTTLGTIAATLVITGNAALDGTSTRSVSVQRHTTSNTAGNSLTVNGGGATSGATDKAGGTLVLKGGQSTGLGNSAAAGFVSVQAYVPATATGTGDNSAINSVVLGRPKNLTNNTLTNLFTLGDPATTAALSFFMYGIVATDGTDIQSEIGFVTVRITNKAGVWTKAITKQITDSDTTSGTLAVTFTLTSANPAAVQVTSNSSLTPTSHQVWINAFNMSSQAMTAS